MRLKLTDSKELNMRTMSKNTKNALRALLRGKRLTPTAMREKYSIANPSAAVFQFKKKPEFKTLHLDNGAYTL